MHLSPADQDKLLLSMAGLIARERRARGESCSTIPKLSPAVVLGDRGARDGRTVSDLMNAGRQVLSRDEVMEGVPEMIDEVKVEATFPDGRKLVTLHEPIA